MTRSLSAVDIHGHSQQGRLDEHASNARISRTFLLLSPALTISVTTDLSDAEPAACQEATRRSAGPALQVACA
jgi:hypothetical protein